MTPAHLEIIRKIYEAQIVGRGPRIKASADRTWLRNKGFIVSAPPNPSGLRSVAGHGAIWKLTELGRSVAKEHGF